LGKPARVAEWSTHSAGMWPRFAPQPGRVAYQRIISNNYYANDEQKVNPGQVKGFDGVIYKL